MTTLIKSFAAFLLAIMPIAASAQDSGLLRQTKVIAELSNNDGATHLMVFSLPENGQDHYFLSVGKMGLGNEVVQVQVDKLSSLHIYLGDTLKDAFAMLEEMKGLFKKEVGASMDVVGCLTPLYPTMDNFVDVTVSHYRPLLTRQLEFRIDRDGYLLANHVDKSEFNSIVSSVKFYIKLHPKEQ